jgi:hypothetical protein
MLFLLVKSLMHGLGKTVNIDVNHIKTLKNEVKQIKSISENQQLLVKIAFIGRQTDPTTFLNFSSLGRQKSIVVWWSSIF